MQALTVGPVSALVLVVSVAAFAQVTSQRSDTLIQPLRLQDDPRQIRCDLTDSGVVLPLTPSRMQETLILRILARVSPDSIRSQMQRLQDFRTRVSTSESCRAAGDYLAGYFRSLELDSVVLDSHVVSGQSGAMSPARSGAVTIPRP
jgi:hypothetical protein